MGYKDKEEKKVKSEWAIRIKKKKRNTNRFIESS